MPGEFRGMAAEMKTSKFQTERDTTSYSMQKRTENLLSERKSFGRRLSFPASSEEIFRPRPDTTDYFALKALALK